VQRLTEERCIASVALAVRTYEAESERCPEEREWLRIRFWIAEHHQGFTSAMGRIEKSEDGVFGISYENSCDCCGAMPQASSLDVDSPVVVDPVVPYSENIIAAGKEIYGKLSAGRPECDCNQRYSRE
jgi:hypothetical protein